MVKSGRFTIYDFPGVESFFASIDTYLIDATWVPKMSWENNTSSEQTHFLQYTTGLKVTKGTEVTNSVGIVAEFKGLSMSIDGQTKTITLGVPPKLTLTFYQRKYRFQDKIFFILNAWGYDWIVGSLGWRL